MSICFLFEQSEWILAPFTEIQKIRREKEEEKKKKEEKRRGEEGRGRGRGGEEKIWRE
jgi:hypothetical protein